MRAPHVDADLAPTTETRITESAHPPGRVEGIWLKRAHRGPMDPVQRATAVTGRGLAGSTGRSTRRQVTIITREAWGAMMQELDARIDPSARRANILISGIELPDTRGRVLRIGVARVVVGGETTPCERMEDALPGLRRAMTPAWRGGVFGQVITGGEIEVGNAVCWEPD